MYRTGSLIVAATLVIGGLAAAEQGGESMVSVPSDPRDLDWADRQSEDGDPGRFSGYLSQPRPVLPGIWGRDDVLVEDDRYGSLAIIPGETPQMKGGQAEISTERWLAHGRWSLHAQLIGVHGVDADPHIVDPSTDASLGLSDRLLAINASATLNLDQQTYSVGTEPMQWGEGIFGSPILTRSWRGFPHVSVKPEEARQIGELGYDPILLYYEAIGGFLDGSRTGASDPLIGGVRSSVRWKLFTATGTYLALVHRHSPPTAQSQPGYSDRTAAALEVRAPAGVDLRSEIVMARWGERWPADVAWTNTLDLLSFGEDEDWRLAFEWYRSEPGFSSAGQLGSWEYRGMPLGDPDGDDAESFRGLLQYNDGDYQSGTVMGLRKSGIPLNAWFGQGPAPQFRRPWRQARLDYWLRRSWKGMWLEARGDATMDLDPDFVDARRRWGGGGGVEYGLRW